MEKKPSLMSKPLCHQENSFQESSDISQDNHIESEKAENGVRLVSLAHAGEAWRLGSTSATWRNALTSLELNPSIENIKKLHQQGIWLAKDKSKPRVAVACSGQGAVWPHMGRELYDRVPAARAAMDRLAAVAKWDVLSLMDEPDINKLLLTRWQMPYVLLVGYAQAHYFESLGFKADIYSGHSLGELLALCLSGAYTPETAWEIFDLRARIMGEMEQENTQDSGMLAVYGPFEVIEKTLQDFPDLCISNYNSPTQYILSGPKGMIAEARRILRREQKIPAMVLNVTMAFHHPHLRAVRKRSLDSLLAMDVKDEHAPMLSNYTAKLYPQNRIGICEHIVDLDENAVRWVECVQSMWGDFDIEHFVEIGPTDTLTNFITEIEPRAHCITSCRKNKEIESIRHAVAELYSLGLIQGPSSYAVPDNLVHEDEPCPRAPVASEQDNDVLPEYIEDIIPILTKITGFERHQLGAHMDLRFDLAMRSSRFPVIINEIEKTFNVQVDFEDLIHVNTVADLAKAVAKIRQLDISTTDDNINIHNEKQDAAIGRSILVQSPIHLDPMSGPLAADAIAKLTPALIVGDGYCGTMWLDFLQALLGEEQVTLVSKVEHAKQRLEHNFKPALMIFALGDEFLHGDTPLLDYANLFQEFLKLPTAYMCLVHEQGVDGFLGSELFAGLQGLLLSATLAHPAMHFKAINNEQGISNKALQGFMQKLLCQDVNMPLNLHCGKSHLSSLQLKPSPWLAAKAGLPLTKGQVIVVTGGDGAILPKALQGVAMLGCTLVLLGRSALPHANCADTLNKLSASWVYYSSDISNPEDVRASLKRIYDEYGQIDGLIHGSNIKQSFSSSELNIVQSEQDFHSKCKELKTILAESMQYGLSYVINMSSLAAWIGGWNQSNDSAFDRALAALLEQFCHRHNIAWRCIWLPPIVEDMRKMMEHDDNALSFNMGFISEAELSELFVRELFCGVGQHVFLYRETPSILNALNYQTPPAMGKSLISGEQGQLFPLKLTVGALPTFKARRNFSVYADFALANQSDPSCPMVDALLMLDAMYKSTEMGFSWWNICGVDNLFVEKPLACPHGVTRESEILIKSNPLKNKDKVSFMYCDAELQAFDISANGRRMPSKQKIAWARMYLNNASYNVEPLWSDNLQDGLNTQNIQEDMLLRKNIAPHGYSGYIFAVECIAGLQNIIMPTYKNYYISKIARIRHMPVWPDVEDLNVFWQMHDAGFGKVFDTQICDVCGNILLTVQGLHVLPNQ